MAVDRPSPAAGADRQLLRCGIPIWVRPIRNTDAPELALAFAHLSATSRYRRFLTGAPTLSDAVLRTLTEIDHMDQQALVALPYESARTIIGVARFVRHRHDPTTADLAVTVADDWHGRGLGGALLDRLGRCATDVGVHQFTGDMLAENRAVLALVRAAGGVLTDGAGSTVTFRIAIDDERIATGRRPDAPRVTPRDRC